LGRRNCLASDHFLSPHGEADVPLSTPFLTPPRLRAASALLLRTHPPSQMSDRANVYRDVMMRLKELDGTNMSSLSSSSSSVDTTSDGWESDDSRLEIAVISADARQDSTSLLLPRDVYDELDASEKVLLPKMLEK
jgi:hypothetical protein